LTIWLADQIYAIVKDEDLASQAMKAAKQIMNEKKVKK
jgi:hypothetical protein